jgi:Raf kinase inhibitor-like YbhB/YbcL family protein
MRFRWLLALMLVAGGSCDDDEVPASLESAGRSITLTGPFDSGDRIPREYTCDGNDKSPPLEWTGASGADEYALTMTDADADGFVHWIVWDISSNVSRLAAGQEPAGAVSGTNSFGEKGYGGPCPPDADHPHTYEFVIFAIKGNPTSDLQPSASAGDLYDAIECCVEGRGELAGTYARRG